MNNFLHYWTAMAVALSSIAFTACGDDDDDDDNNNGTVVNNNDNGGNTNNGGNENGNNGGNENGNTNKLQGLVGTWVLDEKATTIDIQNISGTMNANPWPTITFNANGTFSAITADEDTYEGKYSVDGDKLIYEIIEEDGYSFTLKEGADFAVYPFGEEAADYGFKMLVTKQSISISDDIMYYENGWDSKAFGDAAIIMIHGVYNRQK